MEQRKIILTRGIQGSGKSTWAREWVAQAPDRRIRFNNDDIRRMGGVYWPKDSKALDRRESLLKTVKDEFLAAAMKKGYDIVIDNMNLNPKEFEYINGFVEGKNIITKYVEDNISTAAPVYSYTVEFKDFFDITVEECIRRDSMRPDPIGEKIIRQTWKKYRNFILTELNKRQAELINNKEPLKAGLPDAIIVDLDATVAFNTTGRPFYGEGCAEGIKNDVVCERMRHLLTLLAENDYINIIFVTGREGTPEIISATHDWLLKNHFRYDKVYFREIGDYCRGDICKEKIYNENIKGQYNVIAVFEDSQKCVDMYRRNGLLVLQPNDGKF